MDASGRDRRGGSIARLTVWRFRCCLPLLVVAVACLHFGGCNPTRFYRTSLIPNPTVPARVGRPLEMDEARIAGAVNSLLLSGSTPKATAGPRLSSLWIPRLQFEASLYKRTNEWLEAGLQGRFASGEWARANVAEAMEFPGGDRGNAWMLGGGLRFDLIDNDKPVRMAAILELSMSWIHDYVDAYWAEDLWPYKDTDQKFTDETYRFRFAGGVFIQLYGELVEDLWLFGLAGLETHPTNVTGRNATEEWPDQDLGSNSLHSEFLFLSGLGFEWDLDRVSLTAVGFFPVSDSEELDPGPGLVFQTGLGF